MKVEFVPTILQAAIEENIVVAGNVVGTVKETAHGEKLKFHTAISFPRLYGLIQGFGPTKEDAIIKAMIDGRKYACQLIDRIDKLESELLTK